MIVESVSVCERERDERLLHNIALNVSAMDDFIADVELLQEHVHLALTNSRGWFVYLNKPNH